MDKKIDTLIIAGASITSSPWFTWADIVIEKLKPKKVINLSTKGVGNYYIALSCINAILNSKLTNALCMPMFTTIDKFDMYIDKASTAQYIDEKHKPLNLKGQPALSNEFSFWSTGSHWPLIKNQYLNNFFNTDITCVNNMLIFYSLEKLCKDRNIDLFPLFDMNIWSYLEKDVNEHVINNAELVSTDFTSQPLASTIKPLLSSNWFNFTSLIQYAMDNGLPIYSKINKLHPPSNVHLDWAKQCIFPYLEATYQCYPLSRSFDEKIKVLSNEW